METFQLTNRQHDQGSSTNTAPTALTHCQDDKAKVEEEERTEQRMDMYLPFSFATQTQPTTRTRETRPNTQHDNPNNAQRVNRRARADERRVSRVERGHERQSLGVGYVERDLEKNCGTLRKDTHGRPSDIELADVGGRLWKCRLLTFWECKSKLDHWRKEASAIWKTIFLLSRTKQNHRGPREEVYGEPED